MPDDKFRIGRYWLDTVAEGGSYYRFWYDARTREIRRRSLKTRDVEQAKDILAALHLKEGSGQAEEPGKVYLVTVFTSYREKRSDNLPAKDIARTAFLKILEFMGDDAKVGDFTKRRQKEFIAAKRAEDYAISTISTWLTMANAALNFATEDEDEDGDGTGALLIRSPKIIYTVKAVSEVLNEEEPGPRNWHPTLKQIATLINAANPNEEYVIRFAILAVAFAGRHKAICEAGPFGLDKRYRLLKLNPPGRRQTKKHRATLPVPDPLWPLLSGPWAADPVFVHRRDYKGRKGVCHISKAWGQVRKRAELPPQMIPNSLRHFMATELRHAHKNYGVERVPPEEREMWLGHRRLTVHDGYGTFEPDYLATAKAAVEAILLALDAMLDKPLFRQNAAKKAMTGSGKRAVINLKTR